MEPANQVMNNISSERQLSVRLSPREILRFA
jgi:hypothetical protein